MVKITRVLNGIEKSSEFTGTTAEAVAVMEAEGYLYSHHVTCVVLVKTNEDYVQVWGD